ncbi:MAG TPA: alpha-N-arabinofuranosidase [Blastocatellia bacterium]|nr:alpha-N-arabinofuranosidase [Blastocatellia bacterium]
MVKTAGAALRRQARFAVLALVISSCLAASEVRPRAFARETESFKAALTIRADQPKGTISPNIYGSFSEHLGRGIYDGIWVGEDSPIPNTRGIRNDVIAALKELHLGVLRWPGGCYADEYHWRDGIGPRDKRPKTLNTSWSGVIETNAFGTHEFMDLCDMIGAEPYVSLNVGSGTPKEAMDWIEYMTSATDSALATLRRQNGRDKPWKVAYFGVGNEAWGCGGNMRPEYYADVFKRYATFVKDYSGNHVQRFAVGPHDSQYGWTETLMSQAGRQMQGLSLHYYTLPTGNWGRKGLATGFGEDQWHSTLANTLLMEEFIQKHSAIMDKYDPQKRVGLIVDEWGDWYDAEPGSNPSPLYQQNSIRDAVVAGINLNIFNRHSDRVRMAALAQAINVLQSLILTDKEKMVLTPTYYVFEMYKVHQGATLIPVEVEVPEYKRGETPVPALDASASRDKSGKLHLSLVNLDPNRSGQIALKVIGASGKSVTGEILTAPAMDAINTFDKPDTVKPTRFTGVQIEGDTVSLDVPSKSVVVLEIQ